MQRMTVDLRWGFDSLTTDMEFVASTGTSRPVDTTAVTAESRVTVRSRFTLEDDTRRLASIGAASLRTGSPQHRPSTHGSSSRDSPPRESTRPGERTSPGGMAHGSCGLTLTTSMAASPAHCASDGTQTGRQLSTSGRFRQGTGDRAKTRVHPTATRPMMSAITSTEQASEPGCPQGTSFMARLR